MVPPVYDELVEEHANGEADGMSNQEVLPWIQFFNNSRITIQ